MNPEFMQDELVVVSNRLPLTVSKTPTGFNFLPSSGGLVSALEGLKLEYRFKWVGWPGISIPQENQASVREELVTVHRCEPVFLDDDLSDLYYNGFSNQMLWPLMHYVVAEIEFNEAQYDAYRAANALFCESVLKCPARCIWVHDYHLMLLPEMLRKAGSTAMIGFFLHTPFPSDEIFSTLPVSAVLLRALLSCDLIGFQTYDYARHFLNSCENILGLKTSLDAIEFSGRKVAVRVVPIGVDPVKFIETLESASVREKIADLRRRFEGKKIFLGVDRMDYIKGIPLKLRAFELFLQKNPAYQKSAVLIQVAVPSRGEVDQYRALASHVFELAGRINAQYGDVDEVPIRMLHRGVNLEDLCALYAVSDVCIVTSTRDGMNLVAYEYIVCQQNAPGILVLSNFAGAAQSLSGAHLINPWNVTEIAQSLCDAIELPRLVAEMGRKRQLEFVNTHTAAHWGHQFIECLKGRAQDSGSEDVSIDASELPNALATCSDICFVISLKGIDAEIALHAIRLAFPVERGETKRVRLETGKTRVFRKERAFARFEHGSRTRSPAKSDVCVSGAEGITGEAGKAASHESVETSRRRSHNKSGTLVPWESVFSDGMEYVARFADCLDMVELIQNVIENTRHRFILETDLPPSKLCHLEQVFGGRMDIVAEDGLALLGCSRQSVFVGEQERRWEFKDISEETSKQLVEVEALCRRLWGDSGAASVNKLRHSVECTFFACTEKILRWNAAILQTQVSRMYGSQCTLAIQSDARRIIARHVQAQLFEVEQSEFGGMVMFVGRVPRREASGSDQIYVVDGASFMCCTAGANTIEADKTREGPSRSTISERTVGVSVEGSKSVVQDMLRILRAVLPMQGITGSPLN